MRGKNKDILIFIISTILFTIIFIIIISAFSILKIYFTQTKIDQLEKNKIKIENNPEKTFSGDPLITPAPEIENFK